VQQHLGIQARRRAGLPGDWAAILMPGTGRTLQAVPRQAARRTDDYPTAPVPAAPHWQPPAPPGRRVAGPAAVLPGQPWPAARLIVVIPAHGGAGASTLAALLRRMLSVSGDSGSWRVAGTPALPDASARDIASAGWLRVPPGSPVIIAARGTTEGGRRAVTALAALEGCRIPVAAIAVIGDGAGPEPRQVRQYLDLIGGRAGPAVRVPFTAALRAGGLPDAIRLPRRLAGALDGLLELAGSGAGLVMRP